MLRGPIAQTLAFPHNPLPLGNRTMMPQMVLSSPLQYAVLLQIFIQPLSLVPGSLSPPKPPVLLLASVLCVKFCVEGCGTNSKSISDVWLLCCSFTATRSQVCHARVFERAIDCSACQQDHSSPE